MFAREINYKGIKAVELSCGDYYALVAPSIGCNVLRFRDNAKVLEILRYDENVAVEEIAASPYLWGLQPLYLQNRFEDGVLKTSDGVYRLPINEKARNNHIHGFIHQRAFKVVDTGVDNEKVFVKTEYVYNENDYFYNYFPLCFKLEILVELSKNGLNYVMAFTNNSDKQLPMSAAAHTAINSHFVNGGKQENIRLCVPIKKRVVANNSRWLPTGELADLNEYDELYNNAKICPVLRDINNNHYLSKIANISVLEDSRDFHGCIITDIASGEKVFYETDEKFKFWMIWNQGGFNGFFCPEPLTAMVNAPNIDLTHDVTGYCEVPPNGVYSVFQRLFT